MKGADALGAFAGGGAARKDVTLYMSVTDADDGAEVENASAKRLNPAPVARRFVARG